MHSYDSIGNIKKISIQQVLARPELASIREHMREGLWHPSCKLCRQSEQTTGASARTVRHASAEVIAAIDADPVNFFTLEHIVVNWSNLCNLSCTYCNSDTSTAWQAIQGIPILHVKNEHPDLIKLAQDHGSQVQGLTLGGGEPLLQKGLLDFLQCLNPDQVNVLVTTNISVNLEHNAIYRELRTWPRVTWQVSFENVNPDQFEYVRNGADWHQFVHNIDLMKQHGQQVTAHPAYSVYNALQLVEYYKFCSDHALDIFWCELTHPWDLDVRRYSPKIRAQAAAEIDRVVALYGHTHNMAVTTLERYRHTLVDNTYLINPQYRPAVLPWHQAQEQQLNKHTRFEQLWPEFAQHAN
jgi:organic radical activating enzyme